VSCELRALATPDHLLKLLSVEIILRVLTSFNVQLPAVKKLMGILDSYEEYGWGGLSYYDFAYLLHSREAALRRLIDYWLVPNLDEFTAHSKQVRGRHGKPKRKTAAKLPTMDEFGDMAKAMYWADQVSEDMAKAMYWADQVSELVPIQASLVDVFAETSIYDSVFHRSTDSLALLFMEIIHGSSLYPKQKKQERWVKAGGKCEPPNTCHVSMTVNKCWSTHAEAFVEDMYTAVIKIGGKKELLSSMLRRMVMHVSKTFPMGDLSPEPQSVSHLNNAAASSINSALECIHRVDAAIYKELTSMFPEGWEAQMVWKFGRMEEAKMSPAAMQIAMRAPLL
jgi:hypothetical protein